MNRVFFQGLWSVLTTTFDEVSNAVASETDLPYILGLSERDPDATVLQARQLIAAGPPGATIRALAARARPLTPLKERHNGSRNFRTHGPGTRREWGSG